MASDVSFETREEILNQGLSRGLSDSIIKHFDCEGDSSSEAKCFEITPLNSQMPLRNVT